MSNTIQTSGTMGVVVKLKRGYEIEVKPELEDTEEIDVIGNYSKSEYNATDIVGNNGIAPTVRENHGQVTAIKTKSKAPRETLKNVDLHEGEVKALDLFNHKDQELCPTLKDHNHNDRALYDGLRIRKLTPKECWRLMGFADEDFEKARKVNSDTQLYKQAGNSIVVDVLEAILRNLLTSDRKEKDMQMTIFGEKENV